MADIYSATLDNVKFVCGPIWRYTKTQYRYKANLEAFNARKGELRQLHGRIRSRLGRELQTGGKIALSDVETWLTLAREEIDNRQSVEVEVSQSGCLSSRICRTRILKRRTAELNRIYGQGERLDQMPSLVDDDYPSIVRDDRKIYEALKGKLLSRCKDVKSRLHTQLQDCWKIETEGVKLWLRNVEELSGQAATSFEEEFNNVTYDGGFSRRVKDRNQQLEVLLHEATLLPESLVVDDYSQTLGDGERQSFEEWKEKLQDKTRDVKAKLSTELRQNPEKIVVEHVKQWLQKVEGIIIPTASDVHNQLSSQRPPYLASLVNCVKDLIQEMEKLCNEGDQLPQSLVSDDYSQTLSDDDRKTFAHCNKKLWGKYKDVGRILQSQIGFGKIETEQVQIWKKQVEETTASAADVQNQLDSGPPYTSPLVGRVKELIKEMEKLHDEGCKLPESLVIDDPSASAPPMLTPELQGNHDVKEEILRHLMGDETAKIGVWGMGGVGKTTIMMHVYSQLLNLKESKFKKVVWVTVSETFDAGKIQDEIARNLKGEESLSKHKESRLRAAALSQILEMHKPYVLILDDVWKRIELREVGIPEIPGCKLVLTTRSEEVVRTMECKLVQVNTLSMEDSLKLFKDTARVEALPDDEGTLEGMVGECGGLPLAIKAVAASMKGETNPILWRAALRKLKQGSINVPGAEYDPFRAMQFSYDQLENPNIQQCFLQCVLYPEDAMIITEDLIDCWIDGELIDVDGTLREMKDEGHSILKKLVGNCLLESARNYSGRDCVRMHDLMRTMALRITRTSDPRFLAKAGVGIKELREWDEWKGDLLKVSLMSNYITIVDIPPSLPLPRCPILTTLLLSHNWISTIQENFFEHMPELKVLDLSYNRNLRSLPSSVSELVKLTTLLLRGCSSLKKVPSLSKLTALEKLDLYEAGVEEVPHGLEMLRNLKYLDIGRGFPHDDSRHEEVSAGWENFVSEILPTLSKLQHLGLHHKVPVEGRQLGYLTKLASFYGSVRTWRDMCILFSSGRQSLYHYNVSVGGFGDCLSYQLKSICCSDTEICGKPGLTLMPSDVQSLAICSCNDARSLDALSGFVELQECRIWSCRGVEYVFSGLNQLPKLKWLWLEHLEKLKGLLDSEAALVFPSLEVIFIISCPKINKLLPTWQNLPNLKEILVKDCRELEEIMGASSSSSSGGVVDAKLEKLTLENLPALKSISSLTVASVFGCLKKLHISGCPNLNGYIFGGQFKFSSLHSLEVLKLVGLPSLKSIFNEEADAPSGTETISYPLQSIKVEDCPQLKKIFPHAVQIDSFQNLEWIEVKECDELVEIMEVSSETEEDQSKPILPKLEYLSLIALPELRRICSAFVVPDSLRLSTIEGCPCLDGPYAA